MYNYKKIYELTFDDIQKELKKADRRFGYDNRTGTDYEYEQWIYGNCLMNLQKLIDDKQHEFRHYLEQDLKER